jgi:hypothetical protein
VTYAPQSLKDLRAFLKRQDSDLDDNEVGIVGGPSHVATGTSYHLGLDQLKMSKSPYSARTPRDKAGLANPDTRNAASAIDIDDDLDELRPMSVWMVDQCRLGAPDTFDIREIIYSPDGVLVLQWDRERGRTSEPQPHPDLSHRTHSHFSFYRDTVNRDKTGLFRRFYIKTPASRKAPTMFFLQIKDDARVFISDGINTRPVPGGQWDLTCQPLIAAGVPFIANYPDLESLLNAGGPLVPQGSSGGASKATVHVPAQTLVVDLSTAP